jgi:hypothetical protein
MSEWVKPLLPRLSSIGERLMKNSAVPEAERKHAEFARLAPRFFSDHEMAYIRNRTACGPSVLDVVRAAVRRAAKETP